MNTQYYHPTQSPSPHYPNAAFAVGAQEPQDGSSMFMPATVSFSALGVLLLTIEIVAAYVVGAAIAPSPAKKTTYGIIAMPVGILTGIPGIAVMALIATGGKVLKK